MKYVIDGCEKYTVNGTKFHVEKGEYLIANHFAEGRVEVDSKKTVKGICIDVDPNIISDAVSSFCRPDALIADRDLDVFFNSTSFFENKYHGGSTHLGPVLNELGEEIAKNPQRDFQFSNELFFTLAENIVKDHMTVYKQLQSLNVMKIATRNDLLRRISKGKKIMEASFTMRLDVKCIAQECGLSEFHFFRLFKRVYGMTPHHMLVQLRMQHGWQLLTNGRYAVSDVAMLCGFPDIHSFSKSFKKNFGCPPTAVLA